MPPRRSAKQQPGEKAHRTRMKALQAEMHKKMSSAKVRRGLIIVHTGNGKGKTTAGFGMLARMRSHGKPCAVIQFIKSGRDPVERLLRGPGLDWHRVGAGFTWDTQDRTADIALCRAGWDLALAHLRNPDTALVLLDELNVVLSLGYLPVDEVLAALQARPARQHVVLTGRNAPETLVAAADLVTEMREIKHPFAAGVRAQAGIEF